MPRLSRIAMRLIVLGGLLSGWHLAHAAACEPVRCDCPATGTIQGLTTPRDPIRLKSLSEENVQLSVTEFERLLASHGGAIPVLGNDNGQVIFCTAAGQPVRGRRFYFDVAMNNSGEPPPLDDLSYWCLKVTEMSIGPGPDTDHYTTRLGLSADQIRELQARCADR